MTTRPDKTAQIFAPTHSDKTKVGLTADSVVFSALCQEQFKNYLNSILVHQSNKSASQPLGTSPSPEETFIRKVEAAPGLNITSAQADKFRSEVIAAICGYMQEHKTLNVPYSAYEPLARAIEHYVYDMAASATPSITFSNAISKGEKRKLN